MEGKWIRKPLSDTSIVFVHGILSSGTECWQHADGAYWPDLVRDESSLEQLGIYIFSYQTGIFSGTYCLSDVVDSLKEHLRIDMNQSCRRLIFVCHSMGGIAVRKFLVERAVQLIDKGIEIGLFLLASPSLGSNYANWLSPIARLLNHTQADALRFVESNSWLSELDKEFKNLKESGRLTLSGKELVEDRFVTLRRILRKQVVSPFSGAAYFGEPYKVPESDHFSIAKPASNSAIQHRLLVQFIKDVQSQSSRKPLTDGNEIEYVSFTAVDYSLAIRFIHKHLHAQRQTRMLATTASHCIADGMNISSIAASDLLDTLIDKRLAAMVSGQRIELTTTGLHLATQREKT